MSYDPRDFNHFGRNDFGPADFGRAEKMASDAELDFYDRNMKRTRASEAEFRHLENHGPVERRAAARQARIAADRAFSTHERGLTDALERRLGTQGAIMRGATSARAPPPSYMIRGPQTAVARAGTTVSRAVAATSRALVRVAPAFIARIATSAGSLVSAIAGWAAPVLAIVGAIVAAAGAVYMIYDLTSNALAATTPISPDVDESSDAPVDEGHVEIPSPDGVNPLDEITFGGTFKYDVIPSFVDPSYIKTISSLLPFPSHLVTLGIK